LSRLKNNYHAAGLTLKFVLHILVCTKCWTQQPNKEQTALAEERGLQQHKRTCTNRRPSNESDVIIGKISTVEARKSWQISPCSFGLSATSQQYFSLRKNQPAVLSSHNKSAPAISHRPNEQVDDALSVVKT
jgi:hypothetical protein